MTVVAASLRSMGSGDDKSGSGAATAPSPETADSDDGWFADFSLIGKRFDARGMPAESALEVSHYREALFEIAREIYLSRHEDRQRVPRGFDDAFDLRLVRVDGGSATARVFLNRTGAYASADYDEWFDVFDLARERLTTVFQQVAVNNDSSVRDLSPRERRSVRKVGSTLTGKERLRVGDPAQHRVALVDVEVHATLASIDAALSSAPDTGPVAASAEGVIVEFDSRYQRFELRDAVSDRRIVCHFPSYVPGLASQVRQSMAEDGVTAPDVRVSGVATLDERGYFDRLLDVGSIQVVRPWKEKRLRRRFEEIHGLAAGWHGPGSAALADDVATDLQEFLPLAVDVDVHLALASTHEGHAFLEWRREGVVFSAEIEPGHKLYLCVDDTVSGALSDSEERWRASRLLDFVERGVLRD
ncbi:hypothetical protein [Phycicoccus avicenniae]|uniref:hypothetical protein n=1 Tax=Phycicoccus avicenniae TaxID=2828860 RepID=UPI003D26E1D7